MSIRLKIRGATVKAHQSEGSPSQKGGTIYIYLYIYIYMVIIYLYMSCADFHGCMYACVYIYIYMHMRHKAHIEAHVPYFAAQANPVTGAWTTCN